MRFTLNLDVVLWSVQVFLALFFALGSGAPKLLLPVEALPMPITLPEWFVRFIGTAEVLGALGLILPGLLRTHRGLTPIAAACLAALTVCATVYQLLAHQPESALFAAVMGVICASVAYGRWRVLSTELAYSPA
jgi:DoxX-like family